ncbi:unnamed protein product [Leptidea sinapis]|uniref:Uncharacterized protein n=1 Tax=Leptidea sinapis TaxID=189913 RepID=A0A5E4QYL8_9NEOP|nr:unnamed protein product [Leptidea sinapis]
MMTLCRHITEGHTSVQMGYLLQYQLAGLNQNKGSWTQNQSMLPVCVVPCGSPALAVRWSRRLAVCATGPAPALPLPPAPPRARHLLAVATARALLLAAAVRHAAHDASRD